MITRLKMLKMLSKTNIDFEHGWPAITASLISIVIGLAAVFTRGQGLLDIDFTGGVSVEAYFRQPKDISVIRSELAELPDLVVYGLHSRTEGAEPHRDQHLDPPEHGCRGVSPAGSGHDRPDISATNWSATRSTSRWSSRSPPRTLRSRPARRVFAPGRPAGPGSDLPGDTLASADSGRALDEPGAPAAESAAEEETAGESAPEAGDRGAAASNRISTDASSLSPARWDDDGAASEPCGG